MTGWQLMWRAWSWEPSVVVGCVLLMGGYLLATAHRTAIPAVTSGVSWPLATGQRLPPMLGNAPLGPHRSRPWPKTGSYMAGVVVLLLALVSPLDTLGDRYLFSAHMAQHMLLVLVVPPLLLWGLPFSWADMARRHTALASIEAWIGCPPLSWLLGVGTLLGWHLPVFYEAALRHEGIHIVQHLMFLITATIFWWPVVGPGSARYDGRPWVVLLYLFGAALANSILGIVLTYAPVGIYPSYLAPADTLGILPLLREQWGLTPAADQQAGGLLMWLPGGFVYLFAMIGTLARWYAQADGEMATSGPLAHEGGAPTGYQP